MEELLKTFNIPDNTVMEEHTIVVDGGAIIGNHSDIGFGVLADSVIAGERVKINGNVIGTDEIRIDMWSHVGGDVRTKNDAYIGEFVNIEGKLVVEKDLNIGKDVNIGGGFEAKGWIYVRNPTTNVLIYIFLYLTMLMRLGKNEEVEKALEELFVEDTDNLNAENLLIIPSGSRIDLESIKVPEKAVIGSNCRMIGNIRAASVKMGSNNTLFGSIRTTGEATIGEGNNIHGNIVARGDVRVHKGTHVLGEINGGRIFVHEEAKIDGPMRAQGGVVISRNMPKEEIEEVKTISSQDLALEPAGILPDQVVGKERTKKIAPKKKAAASSLSTGARAKAASSAAGISAAADKIVTSDTAISSAKKRLTTAVRLPAAAETAENKAPKEKKTQAVRSKKAAAKPSQTKKAPKKSASAAIPATVKSTSNKDTAGKSPAKRKSPAKAKKSPAAKKTTTEKLSDKK